MSGCYWDPGDMIWRRTADDLPVNGGPNPGVDMACDHGEIDPTVCPVCQGYES